MKPEELQRAFYEMLMESQFWSPSQMQDYQRGQLEQLLRHARKNVPFYEKRLDPVFTASGDINWDRWEEIPILRRSDAIEHKAQMRAPRIPAGHGPVQAIASSGSTGHPVETLVTRISKIGSDAAAWRSGDWHGLDYSRTMALRDGTDPRIVAPVPLDMGPWRPPWDPAALRGRGVLMTKRWTSAEQLDCLVGNVVSYLAPGGVKSASILAFEAEARGVSHAISRILVNGEEVGEDDRDVCRRVFGAEIIDLYSSKEGGHIAHRCPTGSGYHINSERILVELLDDDGHPVPVGQRGRVVITPFHSTAQPLIRYDQGDLATFGEMCSCGRHLPLISSLDGRVAGMFRHPDGRKKSRGFPMRYLDDLDAKMWQLAQVGPIDFEIRYLPRDNSRVGDEAGVADAFRHHMFEDARVSFRRLDEIPLTEAGKYLEYTYEVPAG